MRRDYTPEERIANARLLALTLAAALTGMLATAVVIGAVVWCSQNGGL